MGKNRWPIAQQAYCCLPLDAGILYSVVALVRAPLHVSVVQRLNFLAQLADCLADWPPLTLHPVLRARATSRWAAGCWLCS